MINYDVAFEKRELTSYSGHKYSDYVLVLTNKDTREEKVYDIYEPHGYFVIEVKGVAVMYGHENILVVCLDTGDKIINYRTR